MTHTTLDDEIILVLKKTGMGFTCTELSELLDRNRTTVYRHLQDLGVPYYIEHGHKHYIIEEKTINGGEKLNAKS